MNAACRRFFNPGFPDPAALRRAAFAAYRSCPSRRPMAASSPVRPDSTLPDAAHGDLSQTAEDMALDTPEGSIGIDDKSGEKVRAGIQSIEVGFRLPVFDAAGELALGLIALGQEGAFDIAREGEIADALRACAETLSYELGYSPVQR
jgi:hypothetical protein